MYGDQSREFVYGSWALRWLNTILQVIRGNLHDSMCFNLNKQTLQRESNGTQKTIS